MRQANLILVGLLVVGAASPARADFRLTVFDASEPFHVLALASNQQPTADDACVTVSIKAGKGTEPWPSFSPSCVDDRCSAALDWESSRPAADDLWRMLAGPATLPVSQSLDDEQPIARELPPAPGSGMLAITGLLPLGGWQVLRSARKVHLGSLPAWYHPSAPHRIGHAVAYDLDVSLLPLCVFDTVCALDNARYGPPEFTHRDCPRRPGSQYFLPATAPRGPPHASREPALIPAGGRAFAHTDPGIDALTYTHFVSRTAKRVYRKE